MAGPRGRDRHSAPPRPSGGVARGPEGPPHSPLPPPTQARERTEADQRNGGPTIPPKRLLHPGCGGTTAEAGAHTPCLLPADSGPATPRTAQTERPYQRPARGRRGREPGGGSSPPLPPPPAALTRQRPTGPRPTPPAARQPPRHEYTPGGTAGATEGRPTLDGAGGRGGGPPRPPPSHPPQLGSQRSSPPPPPEPRGRPPPQKGPRRGGGECGWTCSRGGRGRGAHVSVPEQRAQRKRMGAAPHLTLP